MTKITFSVLNLTGENPQISVKNYCSKARLIMQLLNYKSKSFLQTIPNWDPINYRDENICISEVSLLF